MEHRVVSEQNLYAWLAALMEEQPVMGSRERKMQPGFHHFDWLDDPREFVPIYATTTIPPKAAFFPPEETLFTFKLEQRPRLDMVHAKFTYVLAGVHPCDLAAVDALDAAYGHPPADLRWHVNRRRAQIIGVDCLPDAYCFCPSTATSDFRRTCDLFLTQIDGGYLVEIHSKAGAALLEKASTSAAQVRDFKDAEQWRRGKMQNIKAGFDAEIEELATVLDNGGLRSIWEETAARCYSCGSCNTTCPACFCFNMVDHIDDNLKQGIRKRTWDSCQLPDFAVVAGGHNFRGDRWQRVRHRWQRKFLYLYRRFGRPYCTGCGRCSRACTADINIVDVTNQLIAEGRKRRSP
ncbi:MAG: 4Fe-4S dicluster domain-containing protein [Desulfobacterales bacterium]